MFNLSHKLIGISWYILLFSKNLFKILYYPSKGRPCRRHALIGLSRYILLFFKNIIVYVKV